MAKKIDLTKGIAAAVDEAGGKSRLAEVLGVSRQTISHWRQVPVQRVLQIERLLGVSRHVLRPDVYPEAG